MFNESVDAYTNITIEAGARVDQNLVDLTARTGYSLIGQNPKPPHEEASEYYQFDWEYAQTPGQSSLIASSWVRVLNLCIVQYSLYLKRLPTGKQSHVRRRRGRIL